MPQTGHDGFSSSADMSDPAQVHSHRVLAAVRSEFRRDDLLPRFVVVIEYPAHGRAKTAADARIAIASNGDGAIDIHRMLALGIGAIKRATQRAARGN